MPWIKQGCIFTVIPQPGRTTHAQVPTPLVRKDYIRVYYACRRDGKSFPAFFDLSKDLKTILRHQADPIMEYGAAGMFDSDGIMPSCVMEDRDELYMYYIGWNARASGARYQNEIGIAVSLDGGETFKQKYPGPIIGRSPTEPGLAVMPFVMYENWFRMWYQSGTSWEKIGGTYEPVYVIKYAESLNRTKWKRFATTCVKADFPLEAFSRPCVIKENKIYHMWYCYRGSEDYRGGTGSYRIGYAQSGDANNFMRMDGERTLTPGNPGEWDSQMQCYPYVIECDGRLLMFYNGNDFGQTGIGLAIWKGNYA